MNVSENPVDLKRILHSNIFSAAIQVIVLVSHGLIVSNCSLCVKTAFS